ncbi:hypothetical protein DPMN_010471 [Dreissena polymorpha]|uniref:Uncharacterized protein n=1 Tax=Dreissena polymorpha TaxID=45954 RepID=A0A9D4N1K4_DREPO|nr:hypothetical protein DPMN_010471 [Dreissena polymorpha]
MSYLSVKQFMGTSPQPRNSQNGFCPRYHFISCPHVVSHSGNKFEDITTNSRLRSKGGKLTKLTKKLRREERRERDRERERERDREREERER